MNKEKFIINSNIKTDLKEKGYIVIDDFYEINDIIKMRNIILYNMITKKNMLSSGSKPNFLADIRFQTLIPFLKLNEINKIMKEIFDGPYHFCSHNDIGLNRIVNWHKDTLNNQYKKYQKTDIWSEVNNEKHEIYKVLIYLQDNTLNNNGLTLIEGSHLDRNMNIHDNLKSNLKTIHNKVGSIIIFDQRITHRGQLHNIPGHRILISLGFGKNNIFTDEFEEGTIKRQYDQNSMIRYI
jgi:hypothetical protein